MKKVTLQNIADLLNISKVSVSKAINNQPGISNDLREKILNSAHELGYFNHKPSPVVIPENFAFIVHKNFFLEIDDFYSRIHYYLNNKCQANSITLTLFTIQYKDDDKVKLPEKLTKDNFDGIFIAGELRENYLFALKNLGIPMVAIDFTNPHIELDCILVDNFNLGYFLATHLIDRGHKKIGFVGKRFPENVLDRFYGYKKALERADLPYRDEWNLANNDPQTGYYTLDIQFPEQMPTAFICHCDMSAYFLIQSLKSKNIRVPDDVSVVSFDNTHLAETCLPRLTSVDIDKKKFAHHAFESLGNRIIQPDSPYQRIYLQTSIVQRDSVISR